MNEPNTDNNKLVDNTNILDKIQNEPLLLTTSEQQNDNLYENSSSIKLKRFFVDPYVYSRLIIENNIFNFNYNTDITQLTDNIFIGNYSTSTNLQLLKKNNITHILTVLSDFYPPYPDDFKYLHIEAYDDINENLIYKFPISNLFLKEVEDTNGKVYVHCMRGASRSVTLILAYLLFKRQIKYDMMTEFEKIELRIKEDTERTTSPLYKELIKNNESYISFDNDIIYELLRIKEKRSIALPNISFMKQLQNYYIK